MSVSLLVPHRTVMLVADEAVYVYDSSARGVRLVETVLWSTENFEQNLAGILKKDCSGRPVLILNDMVEQHYRKEKVLKARVSIMDRSGMLRRKLNMAFPSYPVKAALPLKEKIVKDDKRGRADIYIFAAVPETRQFLGALGAINRSLVPVSGFCLLPVESSDLVKTLSAKLVSKGEPKYRWVLFIGQHKNGGLRQIVTKNGELALTRMTPISDSDNDVDVWASEVHHEFKATMSYLSRFGYQPEDGLHVIVIANEAAGEAIETKIEENCKYTALTTAEAARLLNVPLGPQDDFRYADSLHVAWAGRKAKLILPMRATQVDKVSKPRQTANAASVMLGLGVLFLLYQVTSHVVALSGLKKSIDESRANLSQLNVSYNKEIQRKEDLGFDIKLLQSGIAVYDHLQANIMEPLYLLKNVGEGLGKDMRLDHLALMKSERNVAMAIADAVQQNAPPLYEGTLQMTYPSTTDIDKGNKEVADFRDRLAKLLPKHEVMVTKFLKDYEYVEEVVVETGDLKKKDVSQDFVAEISIKGPPHETAEATQ